MQYSGDQGEKILAFRAALTPMRQTLEQLRFLGGEQPTIADILVFALFLVRPARVLARQGADAGLASRPCLHLGAAGWQEPAAASARPSCQGAAGCGPDRRPGLSSGPRRW